jgi:predicted dehydrogenase
MSAPAPVPIAVVGTSSIGRLHAEVAAATPDVALVGLSGLDENGPALAEQLGVPLHPDYRELIDRGIMGVIIATPNRLHLEMGVFFAERGVHVLVEKPIADTLADGKALCAVAARSGVHLLVGHHRRHNALVQEAGRLVAEDLGNLVATNTMAFMKKPDSYFAPGWRRSASAGPLLINLIHDVDLLRAVCGEIDRVQAAATRRLRTFEFPDTAAILLHFRGGAFGTVTISDSAPSPWCWEASVDEGLGRLHKAGQDHAYFAGTRASLSFPSLTMWSYDPADGEPGWRTPLRTKRVGVRRNHPYADQISQFAAVIRGEQAPLVPGEEGLRSLAVVIAAIEATASGGIVDVDDVLGRA